MYEKIKNITKKLEKLKDKSYNKTTYVTFNSFSRLRNIKPSYFTSFFGYINPELFAKSLIKDNDYMIKELCDKSASAILDFSSTTFYNERDVVNHKFMYDLSSFIKIIFNLNNKKFNFDKIKTDYNLMDIALYGLDGLYINEEYVFNNFKKSTNTYSNFLNMISLHGLTLDKFLEKTLKFKEEEVIMFVEDRFKLIENIIEEAYIIKKSISENGYKDLLLDLEKRKKKSDKPYHVEHKVENELDHDDISIMNGGYDITMKSYDKEKEASVAKSLGLENLKNLPIALCKMANTSDFSELIELVKIKLSSEDKNYLMKVDEKLNSDERIRELRRKTGMKLRSESILSDLSDYLNYVKCFFYCSGRIIKGDKLGSIDLIFSRLCILGSYGILELEDFQYDLADYICRVMSKNKKYEIRRIFNKLKTETFQGFKVSELFFERLMCELSIPYFEIFNTKGADMENMSIRLKNSLCLISKNPKNLVSAIISGKIVYRDGLTSVISMLHHFNETLSYIWRIDLSSFVFL